MDNLSRVVIHRSGGNATSWTDPVAAFFHRLTEKHEVSDTEFLIDAGGCLPVLARHGLSGQLNYSKRNLIVKWFQTVSMRIDCGQTIVDQIYTHSLRVVNMEDTDPVVVQAMRTPQGKQDGVFADMTSEQLSVPLVNKILAKTSLSSDEVDDVMWGCARPEGEQGSNIARVIALTSELGENVPGTTVDRLCASSAQAIMSASDAIRAGQRDCIVTGGVENMTRVQRKDEIDIYTGIRDRYDTHNLWMGSTAEAVAERYDISREEQDSYGARSQQRAVAATEQGRFNNEIIPIHNGEKHVTKDEGLRPSTTAESIADLPPAFEEDGTVTAATSSQISDGAAALLVTSQTFARDHGLDVVAKIGNNNVAGVDPEVMGIGPVPAVRGLFERSDTTIEDYDLVELNEAFASQTLYCQRELGIPDDIFNANGGAIAIGHPLGASGARLPVTLIHEMHRRGAEHGLSTQCVGYGQGGAIEFSLP